MILVYLQNLHLKLFLKNKVVKTIWDSLKGKDLWCKEKRATYWIILREKKVEDPSFFYSMQLYVDDLIINIFWDDVKMITDFNLLGDGVSFDTTYQTNKNYRPLAIFIGMNNHIEEWWFLVLLKCMMKYIIASFEWLFTTFLRAMSEKKSDNFDRSRCHNEKSNFSSHARILPSALCFSFGE